jgi:hypothetical protein
MRMQAMIVVVIGVCICIAIIWFKGLESELQQLRNHRGYSQDTQEQIDFLEGMQILLGVWLFVQVILLTAVLFRLGHRKYRIRYGKPPADNLELLNRIMPRRTPFQFSILTMLALMLAVALICATVKCLFLT